MRKSYRSLVRCLILLILGHVVSKLLRRVSDFDFFAFPCRVTSLICMEVKYSALKSHLVHKLHFSSACQTRKQALGWSGMWVAVQVVCVRTLQAVFAGYASELSIRFQLKGSWRCPDSAPYYRERISSVHSGRGMDWDRVFRSMRIGKAYEPPSFIQSVYFFYFSFFRH
jgi:hypothetical protein